MKRVNVNLYPKDGYFFKEKDGSVHRSTRGWGDLIGRVAAYRRRNNLPPGDPAVEVHTQACENNPGYCYEDASPIPTPPRTVKTAVLQWVMNLRANKSKVSFVAEPAPTNRASICASCPFNVALKEGCAPCARVISEARKEILGGRRVDGRLHACEKFGSDAATMVHIDTTTVERPDLPDHCWLKRKI